MTTRITIQMLKQRMDDGAKLLIIDSRSEGAYRASALKIKGAIRIAYDKVGAELKSGKLKSFPKTGEIITYCSQPGEAASDRVARTLTDNGFRNVRALIGGFEAWQKAGYAVEPKDVPATGGAGKSGGKKPQRKR
ncbi:MAG TPA: rhodanese-like domain-containing protein [Blastocatellia bacterium]|nr:rhodanese-like domain-containing protein [Blastocatellia bacterium]